MPKPTFVPEESLLMRDIQDTLLAGLKQWRPDLAYPQSASDMQGMLIALLQKYEVKLRPIAVPLKVLCHRCLGAKYVLVVTYPTDPVNGVNTECLRDCQECGGKGYKPFR